MSNSNPFAGRAPHFSVPAPVDLVPPGDAEVYALILTGHCLEPEVHDGQLVIASPNAPLKRGGYAVLVPPEGKGQPICKRIVATPDDIIPIMDDGGEIHQLIVFEMLNPPKQWTVRMSRFAAVHGVYGFLPASAYRGPTIQPEAEFTEADVYLPADRQKFAKPRRRLAKA